MNKLWVVTRTTSVGYDEFESMVVVAPTEDKARRYHPTRVWDTHEFREMNASEFPDLWERPETLMVEEIGLAADHLQDGAVVCASFNAG